ENNTWFVIGLAIVSIAILFVMVWLYTRIAKEDVYARAGLILIIAGALGNLISRLSYGYVVDMFSFYINGYSWPAFNIADASISIGATLIILTLIFFTDREKNIFS
ncbi:MAG: signal peptidase II, partial [Nitrospinota bacterium]